MCRDTVVSMPVTDPSPRTGLKYLKMNYENMNFALDFERMHKHYFAQSGSEIIFSKKQFKIVYNWLE